MTTKFQRSWQVFKVSIALTLRHRKLLLFPVLTAFLTSVICLFFLSAIAVPLVLHPTGYHLNDAQHWAALGKYYFTQDAAPAGSRDDGTRTPEGGIAPSGKTSAAANPSASTGGRPHFRGEYVVGLLVYLSSMFLATFFNVAFYSEIIAAMNGKGVSFRRGLATARDRWRSILAWSMLAGVVGWIIRTIEEKLPFAGRIVMGLIGLAWSVAAVFAIPVIIQEKPEWNPIKTLRQSALTLKRTWGEALIGYTGFSAAGVVLVGLSLLPLAVMILLAVFLKSVWLGVVAGVVWVLAVILMSYVSSVAGHVYRCALYLYAAEGVVVEPYDSQLLDMAWKVKKA